VSVLDASTLNAGASIATAQACIECTGSWTGKEDTSGRCPPIVENVASPKFRVAPIKLAIEILRLRIWHR
jgi:hypothetical protein